MIHVGHDQGEGVSPAPDVAPAPSRGFPKSARLRVSSEFQRTVATGKKRATRAFVLYAAAGKESGGCRLGITASRKVGKAVVRNRVKRVVREAFRTTRQVMIGNWEFVVIARSVAATLENNDLRRELAILFKPYLPGSA